MWKREKNERSGCERERWRSLTRGWNGRRVEEETAAFKFWMLVRIGTGVTWHWERKKYREIIIIRKKNFFSVHAYCHSDFDSEPTGSFGTGTLSTCQSHRIPKNTYFYPPALVHLERPVYFQDGSLLERIGRVNFKTRRPRKYIVPSSRGASAPKTCRKEVEWKNIEEMKTYKIKKKEACTVQDSNYEVNIKFCVIKKPKYWKHCHYRWTDHKKITKETNWNNLRNATQYPQHLNRIQCRP